MASHLGHSTPRRIIGTHAVRRARHPLGVAHSASRDSPGSRPKSLVRSYRASGRYVFTTRGLAIYRSREYDLLRDYDLPIALTRQRGDLVLKSPGTGRTTG